MSEPKKVITLGEIMMRLSTPGNARFTQATNLNILYAGAEANVAASTSLFGIKTAHVTRFPDTDLGVAATQTLNKLGIDTSYIYTDHNAWVCIFREREYARSSRIIYDRSIQLFLTSCLGL